MIARHCKIDQFLEADSKHCTPLNTHDVLNYSKKLQDVVDCQQICGKNRRVSGEK